MRTRIKFCGMTRAVDVQFAAALGVDAIGLVFASRSPRCLDIAAARRLHAVAPAFVARVALVMDEEAARVQVIVQSLRPHLLQFHGSEPAEECGRYGIDYLKAIPMADGERASQMLSGYPAAAGFVLDGHAAGETGGSGRGFEWSRIPAAIHAPILLAGGLSPENVFAAVRAVRPWAVDVSSGIEHEPGIKDPDKMRRFVAEVRRADQASD